MSRWQDDNAHDCWKLEATRTASKGSEDTLTVQPAQPRQPHLLRSEPQSARESESSEDTLARLKVLRAQNQITNDCLNDHSWK